MDADNGLRSLVRCYSFGGTVFNGYRIFKAHRCRADDPNVVIHNQPLHVVQRYRKLIEDPN
jgi:hypothetical protein